MNAPRDPDRLIHAFLQEGRTELTDQVYDVVRADIEHQRQRVVFGPWRMPDMNKLVAIGLGVAAVIAVIVVGSQFLGPPAPSGVGGAPSTTPATTPAPPAASPSSSGYQQVDPGLSVGPFAIVDGGDPDATLRSTVAIPAPGWTHDPNFGLIAKGTEVDNLPEAALLSWAFPAGTRFDVYGDPCTWQSTKPGTPAATIEEIAAALAAQANRDASEPTDVTIGGYPGKHITLHVPDDPRNTGGSFVDCDSGEFATYGIAGSQEATRTQQGPGQIDELYIVDVDGAFMVLDAMYRPDTPAELVEELRSIAESATFAAP